MWTKFVSKVLSYENGRGKLLTFSVGRYFFCSPVKYYPFLRTAATAASEACRKDGAASKECPGLSVPLGKKYLVQYFLNQEEYRSLVLDPDNLNFETEGRPESVHILKDLTGSSEDEELFEKLKSSLLKEKEILHVEEICKSLFCTYKHKENNLAQEIASLLETELLKRKLSKPEIIKVLYTFYETWGRVNTKSFLHVKLVNKICDRISSLPPKQSVVFFYSCKLKFRKETLKCINYNVINHVTNIIPSLDSIELGIIVRGLLRCNFSCHNFLLKKNFMQRIMELSGSIDEKSLLSICELLKLNLAFMDGPYLLEFQESLIPHLSKYDYSSLNSLVAVGVRISCLNSSLWEKVAKICKENINDCTFYKVLSMISTLTHCDVADEELMKLAIEKFERAVEDGTIDNFGNRKWLILFLNNLIHHRIYPKKLLDVVFAEGLTFFKPDAKYGSYIKAKYWETKCFLDIDKPEFNYNSFSEEETRKLSKLCKYVLPSLNDSTKFYNNPYNNFYNNFLGALNTMTTVLVNSYGDEEKVYLSVWHPVYPKGLFLRFDQNLNAQKIPDDFRSLGDYYPKKALKDDHIWAFVALNPAAYYFGTEKLKLSVLTQVRHLQAFGYEPIMVHYNAITHHIKEKTVNEYLNNLISEHLHKTR